MTETPTVEPTKKSSSGKPLLFIGIGCVVILAIVGAGLTFAAKFLVKKAGTSLIQSAIENKTGVKTDLSDLEKGKVSFTDTKTGEKVDIGQGKIPDTFPKDFPVYKDAKVSGSMSGNTIQDNGFWISLTTPDATDKVVSFYKDGLKANGWSINSTMEVNGASTFTLSKGEMEGTVSISRAEGETETIILITLGQNKNSPAASVENSGGE